MLELEVLCAVATVVCILFAVVQQKASQKPDAVREGFVGLIGNTPLVELKSLSKASGCTILGKAEFLNPGGSLKDRVAKQIVLEAERDGRLTPGGTIYEGTAGSTGIALAQVARARGYRCQIYMASDMSEEKSSLLRTLGAQVERVPPCSIVDPAHFCNIAQRRGEEDPKGLFADQFENEANFRAHYTTTGPEIWQQTGGKVDAFVAGSGTGGTIAGVSCYLKQQKAAVNCFLVDPPGSGLYNKVVKGVMYASTEREGTRRRHQVDTICEGIGINRITKNFGKAQLDGAFQATDKEAVEMANFLLKKEGLFLGSSSAVNCVGAMRVAEKLGPGHTIVTVLCDGGGRYMSKLYNEDFLKERELLPEAEDLEFLNHMD